MDDDAIRPLLAAKFDRNSIERELQDLTYPLITSPKIDGIRVLQHPRLGAVTRKMKAVPNLYTWETMKAAGIDFLDGEVTVGPPHTTGDGTDVFNRTTCIMGREGKPSFQYHVFDTFAEPGLPYHKRFNRTYDFVRTRETRLPWLKVLELKVAVSPEDVLRLEGEYLDQGYEGIMLRHFDSPYKFGRSTLKQQHLIKIKRVEDDDAEIIDILPRRKNMNELTRDEQGYAKRSSHKDNKVELPMVGRFIVRSSSFKETFGIGSGFDHVSAARWWEQKDSLKGQTITFKYQKCGTIDRPRHPIFLRFRHD
jgi:DNA ligase-1